MLSLLCPASPSRWWSEASHGKVGYAKHSIATGALRMIQSRTFIGEAGFVVFPSRHSSGYPKRRQRGDKNRLCHARHLGSASFAKQKVAMRTYGFAEDRNKQWQALFICLIGYSLSPCSEASSLQLRTCVVKYLVC
jgi:hypothetical protein